ncbi:helix-turn-helix transcriptional regulator [Candidatus Bipolaricaulota bacterium]|nr:helix-turn-helix transcriptional regulator [Candidatus Bipolaricaulota bacterium]
MTSWISQFRRGLLELCVLNLLAAHEDHGYQIVQRLQQVEGLELRESTVYPILARLKSEGYLTVRSEPSPGGPPRRVFRLSAAGEQRLRSLNAYWDLLTASVERLRSQGTEEAEGRS